MSSNLGLHVRYCDFILLSPGYSEFLSYFFWDVVKLQFDSFESCLLDLVGRTRAVLYGVNYSPPPGQDLSEHSMCMKSSCLAGGDRHYSWTSLEEVLP